MPALPNPSTPPADGVGPREPPSFQTKTDYAHEELRRRIVRGDLAPDERLDLNVLSSALGISRMPVREALSRLATQGLVEIHPQRWTSVTPLSRTDVIDTYEARLALETALAVHGVEQLSDQALVEMTSQVQIQRELAEQGKLEDFLTSDRRFHDILYEQARMPRTHGLISDLRDIADRYVYLFLEDQSHRWESIGEHAQIVAFCQARDVKGLHRCLTEHIVRGRAAVLANLERDARNLDANQKESM